MSRVVFVTGTGTGIGKTVVAAAMVGTLRTHGVDAVPAKPIQTGAVVTSDGLVADDLEFCLAATDLTPDADERRHMTPYLYEPACSPHLAGRMAGRYPDVAHLCASVAVLCDRHDVVVVEGAGGVMVPINESETMLDLMRRLGGPVILVAAAELGTINHTLLSIAALRASGLDILGVVFNEADPPGPADDFIRRDNPDVIARFGGVRVLGTLRHRPGLSPHSADLWRQCEQDLADLWPILEGVVRE